MNGAKISVLRSAGNPNADNLFLKKNKATQGLVPKQGEFLVSQCLKEISPTDHEDFHINEVLHYLLFFFNQ